MRFRSQTAMVITARLVCSHLGLAPLFARCVTNQTDLQPLIGTVATDTDSSCVFIDPYLQNLLHDACINVLMVNLSHNIDQTAHSSLLHSSLLRSSLLPSSLLHSSHCKDGCDGNKITLVNPCIFKFAKEKAKQRHHSTTQLIPLMRPRVLAGLASVPCRTSTLHWCKILMVCSRPRRAKHEDISNNECQMHAGRVGTATEVLLCNLYWALCGYSVLVPEPIPNHRCNSVPS